MDAIREFKGNQEGQNGRGLRVSESLAHFRVSFEDGPFPFLGGLLLFFLLLFLLLVLRFVFILLLLWLLGLLLGFRP